MSIINNQDVVDVNLDLLNTSIDKLRNIVYNKYKENVDVLSRTNDNLVNYNWLSNENAAYVEKYNQYLIKLKEINEFYKKLIDDLIRVKIEMEAEMKKNYSVHYA